MDEIQSLIQEISAKIEAARRQLLEASIDTAQKKKRLQMLRAVQHEWQWRIECYRRTCNDLRSAEEGKQLPFPLEHYERQKEKEERILRRIANLFQ
jgi:hypothetical protein